MSDVTVTSARIDTAAGRRAATVDLVDVGGGTQVVTVDGVKEERTHPTTRVYHVRLLSPDRMIPDELREVGSYDAAVELGRRYAAKVDEHQARIDELAEGLTV